MQGIRGVMVGLLGVFVVLAVSGRAVARDPLVVVDQLPPEQATLPDGTVVTMPAERVWRPICGSDTTQLDQRRFEQIVADARASLSREPSFVINNANRGVGGLDLQFNIIGSLPAGAAEALADVEAFVESQFTDDVIVSVTFRMFNMGGGVLGSTGSNYTSSLYPGLRDGLVADMDGDDVIQAFLPEGSTVPVRYNASTTTITNEDRVWVTRANFSAAMGQTGGSAASVQLNTSFPWDYDPSDGVPGSLWCFQSVLVHEVGHVIGFTSGVDFRSFDMETLDLYRFQRTDGSGDWNPDTFSDFQNRARTLDFNNLNDDANSDVITDEYRMEDGSPSQASHFRQSVPAIMDPNLGGGETFFPNFYRTEDLTMFDAIGWDFSDCNLNSVPDQTEIEQGAEDLNGNGILDECERNAPLAEATGGDCAFCVGEAVCIDGACYTPKNRYLSIRPQNAGSLTALRITHVGSGLQWWVGEPDADGLAPLVASPEFRDWSSFTEVVNVGGCAVLPGASYSVQSLLDIDDPLDEGAYSPVLSVPTVTNWGDAAGASPSVPPDGSVSFIDVSAVVDAFREVPGALSVARSDLSPETPDGTVNFQDISATVDAFRELGYPFPDPTGCP